MGATAGRADLISRAAALATAAAALQRPDGSLPGFVSPDWRPLAPWSCVTGNAQMALNWMRIAHLTGDDRLLGPAKKANEFNMSVQDLCSTNPGVRGGIPGSFPFDGKYMAWRFPNWAAKFFIDALLLEREGNTIGAVGA